MKSWTIYILRCRDNSLYTGITTDVARRIREHNAGKGGGYTRSHRPVVLVYTQKRRTRSAALKREAAIKKLTKREKEILIKKHPN